ncbi:Hsp70 family protein [Paracoccus shanxieyensis]|uniref:Hsp70 family protein n=1 Tax=Paracoccus shanxieyensis TaxID=2675752 RepID=A0A6L6J018_9RHOB|nr:Hsp70 family protein [Paracoccus shanxieyensis]MTH65178.1 Hsp70 family protein [Paracoccus shanxieyensis]MTH88322.1 Hsp70 family protein [Paracoccus shanxieyensis]
MQDDIIAVDFGTSNTAAAMLEAGRIRRIPIEAGAETLPTAVFFPARKGAMKIGLDAAEALIDAEEGRYMRALKSVLGTPLLHEQRLIGGQRRSVADIIAAFLTVLKSRAEAATGRRFSRVLSGRPVHFHTRNPERDAQAEADLRGCYLAAGFHEVDFLPEPEAAALASHALAEAGLGLIVDIGGGTSDFSVFRSGDQGVQILANHGIRLGGTDFDHAVSMTHAMPALGHGGTLKRQMGAGVLPVPNAIYSDLATWARIPFLYIPETRRMAQDMAKLATEPAAMQRLVTVLDEELGHELAFAVERGKIAANGGDGGQIAMGFIQPGLTREVTPQTLEAALLAYRAELLDAARDTLALANVAPDQIGSVVLVGGSSLMGLVSSAATELCPQAALKRSDAFTAVVDGLALGTARLAQPV